jgi:hypothetical protein
MATTNRSLPDISRTWNGISSTSCTANAFTIPYHGLYKVMTGKYFSVNVVRWGNLPVFMQVANAKIADGMFYQSMTVLGIIMLHQVAHFPESG